MYYLYTDPAQVENITEVSFSNSSLTIKWMAPPGQVERYIVNISSAELSMSKELAGIENLTEIGNLTAGRVYNITVSSVSGILKNISSVVSFATSELEKLYTFFVLSPEHQKQHLYQYNR